MRLNLLMIYSWIVLLWIIIPQHIVAFWLKKSYKKDHKIHNGNKISKKNFLVSSMIMKKVPKRVKIKKMSTKLLKNNDFEHLCQ